MAPSPPKFPADVGTFIVGVSSATGIDPRVVSAWVTQEGAYTSQGSGGYNYLNLKAGPGTVGVVGTASNQSLQFRDVQSAITSTVNRLNQPFASNIVKTAQAKGTPAQQISAISNSAWASNHYGTPAGTNLFRTFSSQWGESNLTMPPMPGGKITIGVDFASGQAQSLTSEQAAQQGTPFTGQSGIGQAAGYVAGQGAKAAADVFLSGTGLRILQVLGGAILAGMGVFLLIRQIGLSAPSTPLQLALA